MYGPEGGPSPEEMGISSEGKEKQKAKVKGSELKNGDTWIFPNYGGGKGRYDGKEVKILEISKTEGKENQKDTYRNVLVEAADGSQSSSFFETDGEYEIVKN